MKKLLLLIPVLTFSFFGCTQSNDFKTSSSTISYESSITNDYSDIIKHFEERDSTVVSIHESKDGMLTILVLDNYNLEVYRATLIGEAYFYTLLNRM